MTSSARAGRRRRLLHEGATNASVRSDDIDLSAGSNARYTPPAESASFAVAGSVAPRSPLALFATVAGLAVVTAAITFADRFGTGLAASGINTAAARLLMVDQPGSLAAWWEACLWLAVTGQCVLLFGLRRHRTDDMSSAYRWWLIAAAAAVGMSINSATHAHEIVAGQLAALTGFSPLPNDSFWWLAPAVIVLGMIGLRSFLEVKESPLAFFFTAIASFAAVVAVVAGVLPAPSVLTGGLAPSLISTTAAMVMAGGVLTALLAYSRRIVRETLGEIERPASKADATSDTTSEDTVDRVEEEATLTPIATKATKPSRRRASAVTVEVADGAEEQEDVSSRRSQASTRSKPKRPKLAKETTTTEWVSGPEADDEYDEGPKQRKLSKAERKRLRREKARRAA